MKKIILSLAILALCAAPVLAGVAVTVAKFAPSMWEMTYTWTAAADGSVTATAGDSVDGFVVFVLTNPGSVAPTDNYDVLLVNSDGADALGDTGTASVPAYDGGGANRDTAKSEYTQPLMSQNYGAVAVNGPLTLYIKNNSQALATGTVKVYYVK